MGNDCDSLPPWEPCGLLPAVDPRYPNKTNSSPYRISLSELVIRFGTSAIRRRLLLGLLDYRKALYRAGISGGFQWVSGSFVEDVENRKGRGPADIDIATFL